jgi:hypothetical protein
MNLPCDAFSKANEGKDMQRAAGGEWACCVCEGEGSDFEEVAVAESRELAQFLQCVRSDCCRRGRGLLGGGGSTITAPVVAAGMLRIQ